MTDKSLRQYQQEIDEWVQGFEKPYWSPLSVYARIVEEVGELGRILNHTYGDKPKKPSEDRQDLAEEMADILYALICQANSEGIRLDDALDKVITKAKTRDRDRFQKKST